MTLFVMINGEFHKQYLQHKMCSLSKRFQLFQYCFLHFFFGKMQDFVVKKLYFLPNLRKSSLVHRSST